MKGRNVILAVGVALAIVAVPAVVQAQNADPNAKATYLGKIKVQGKAATLRVRYRCASGEALWVSAKQVKSRQKDPALKKEGSSKVAVAWWQSHRNKFTCDGTFPHGEVHDRQDRAGQQGQAQARQGLGAVLRHPRRGDADPLAVGLRRREVAAPAGEPPRRGGSPHGRCSARAHESQIGPKAGIPRRSKSWTRRERRGLVAHDEDGLGVEVAVGLAGRAAEVGLAALRRVPDHCIGLRGLDLVDEGVAVGAPAGCASTTPSRAGTRAARICPRHGPMPLPVTT